MKPACLISNTYRTDRIRVMRKSLFVPVSMPCPSGRSLRVIYRKPANRNTAIARGSTLPPGSPPTASADRVVSPPDNTYIK